MQGKEKMDLLTAQGGFDSLRGFSRLGGALTGRKNEHNRGRKAVTKATNTSASSRAKKPATATRKASVKTATRTPASAKTGAAATHRAKTKKTLTKAQQKKYRDMLLSMRRHVNDQIKALKGDSLTRADEVNTVEDGTDA